MTATDPMLLPHDVPSISDFQRAKVLRAERELSSDEPAVTADALSEVAARASEVGGGLLTVDRVPGDGSVYVRESESQGLLSVGEGATLHAAVRGAAHHVVHPVFPPHGVEWVRAFLRMLREQAGNDVARQYDKAYEDLEVHADPAVRVKRVRKSALGAVNKERGVLARVIADDGPESIVCQLLEIADRALLISNARGERELPLDRLRYMAYRLSDR